MEFCAVIPVIFVAVPGHVTFNPQLTAIIGCQRFWLARRVHVQVPSGVEAADRCAQIVARTLIRGCGGRDEEPSFEMEVVVMAARLDVEQSNAFSIADLAILSDDFPHVANSVICDLLNYV